MKLETVKRRRISVRGVVQGVGFRPFVYTKAKKHHLAGWVCNTSGDVQIEVEGEAEALAAFERELVRDVPPLARIEHIAAESAPPAGYTGFEIRESRAQEGQYQLVSPDIATCEPCRREILDPLDRRYRYPFTNCTNCGPRFTIIADIPYDRPNTTMRVFRMCPRCQAEYDDPLDRRFHAQPNACPVCGPQLSLVDADGIPLPLGESEGAVKSTASSPLSLGEGEGEGEGAILPSPPSLLPGREKGDQASGPTPLLEEGKEEDLRCDVPSPLQGEGQGEGQTRPHPSPLPGGEGASSSPPFTETVETVAAGFSLRQGSPHPDPLPGGEGVEGKGVGARDGEVAPDTVASTARLLREGRILALKGLGGFHLACDATDEAAVRRLRERKRRPHKPLALMMADMDEVRRHCLASAEEEDLLRSPQVPIVLLPWRADSCVAQAVAPGNRYLGVMLPYTPLHHLLLRDVGRPLVMTSGNLSEEPIAKDNDEARRRLSGIADAFLLHNRDIYARYDDSVFLVECGAPRPIRRARGYAPFPVRLPFRARQALACGAELKNTFCLTKDEYAFVSQHIGDLENLETLEHFQDTLALYERLFRIQPELVAYDLHPDYLATQFALEQPLPGVGVQHHHAHIVACMAENGARGPVIGVALDGTGYGTDGTIWGGEFLLAEYSRFQRLGHLQALPMPGGAAAIERPYRMAYAYLKALLGEVPPDLGFLAQVPAAEQALMAQQMEQGLNAPLTSSCGRLFDGVSALLGVRGVANYEAQAAIELEMAAADVEGTYPYCIIEHNGVLVVELAPLFGELVAELRRGRPVPEMAGRFHNTVAALTLDVCRRLREITGTGTVALSGGVFQNRRLFRQVNDLLAADGFEVLNHRQVPCNDGGISLGQAVVASSTLW